MPAPRPSRTDDYDARIDAMRNAQRRAEFEGRPSAKAFDEAARRLIAERDRRR